MQKLANKQVPLALATPSAANLEADGMRGGRLAAEDATN